MNYTTYMWNYMKDPNENIKQLVKILYRPQLQIESYLYGSLLITKEYIMHMISELSRYDIIIEKLDKLEMSNNLKTTVEEANKFLYDNFKQYNSILTIYDWDGNEIEVNEHINYAENISDFIISELLPNGNLMKEIYKYKVIPYGCLTYRASHLYLPYDKKKNMKTLENKYTYSVIRKIEDMTLVISKSYPILNSGMTHYDAESEISIGPPWISYVLKENRFPLKHQINSVIVNARQRIKEDTKKIERNLKLLENTDILDEHDVYPLNIKIKDLIK